MPDSKAARERAAAVRTAQRAGTVWENRKTLVKKEMEAESAANDAKTARCKRAAAGKGSAGGGSRPQCAAGGAQSAQAQAIEFPRAPISGARVAICR
jgi:hypothetical protein